MLGPNIANCSLSTACYTCYSFRPTRHTNPAHPTTGCLLITARSCVARAQLLPHGSRPAPVLLCRTLYILAWEFVVCSTTRTVRSARVYVYFVLLGASMAACFHSLGRCTELPLLLHYLGLLALIVVAALRASFVCTLCVRMSLPFGKCVPACTHLFHACASSPLWVDTTFPFQTAINF